MGMCEIASCNRSTRLLGACSVHEKGDLKLRWKNQINISFYFHFDLNLKIKIQKIMQYALFIC